MRTKRELAKNIVDHDGGCPSDPFIECEDCPIYKVCIDCPPNLTTGAWHKHRKKLAAEIVNQAVADNLCPRTRRKPAFKRLSSHQPFRWTNVARGNQPTRWAFADPDDMDLRPGRLV